MERKHDIAVLRVNVDDTQRMHWCARGPIEQHMQPPDRHEWDSGLGTSSAWYFFYMVAVGS